MGGVVRAGFLAPSSASGLVGFVCSLCLYLVSLRAVRLSGQALDPPLGLPRVCCRGSGYWT